MLPAGTVVSVYDKSTDQLLYTYTKQYRDDNLRMTCAMEGRRELARQ